MLRLINIAIGSSIQDGYQDGTPRSRIDWARSSQISKKETQRLSIGSRKIWMNQYQMFMKIFGKNQITYQKKLQRLFPKSDPTKIPKNQLWIDMKNAKIPQLSCQMRSLMNQ